MNKRKRFLVIPIVVLALVMILAACGPSKAELLAQTATAQQISMGTATAKVEATQAMATQQQETVIAETQTAATATSESIASATAFRETSQANAQLTIEAAIQQKTQTASSMQTLVTRLYEGDFLTSTAGSYEKLDDHTEAWAQINWLRVNPMYSVQVKDFVLKLRIGWESATTTNNFTDSGCGIAFRIDDDFRYYTYFLSLDKKLSYWRNMQDSPYVTLSKRYFGEYDHMQDSRIIIITAEGPILQVFDENLNRIDMREDGKLESGFLGYTLSSGESKSFGTRCSFTEMELWRLGE